MNPYETDLSKVPATDGYINDPLYGRYLPQPDDFHPDLQHSGKYTPESYEYWNTVLAKCNARTTLFDNPWGGRDVFAVGGLIIKSAHLKPGLSRAQKQFYVLDQNERLAIELVRPVLEKHGIQVPQVYFAGQLRGHDVLIQSRIPGVALCVAMPYLSNQQKQVFKTQCRNVLRVLQQIESPGLEPSYLFKDLTPAANRANKDISDHELDILHNTSHADGKLYLMHNDLTESNIIVKDDKIVAICDWEQAGWFGWEATRAVHRQYRTQAREFLCLSNLTEDQMLELTFWSDLYDLDS